MVNKRFYRNRLPHLVPEGGRFFVTFCIKGLIPVAALRRAQEKYTEDKARWRKDYSPLGMDMWQAACEYYFQQFDRFLDTAEANRFSLATDLVAQVIQERFRQIDGELCDVLVYTVMPTHVHAVLDFGRQCVDQDGFFLGSEPEQYIPLSKVMHLIKGGSSREINRILGRTGSLWAKDSYDHLIRSHREAMRIIDYILMNPVKAGLVSTSNDWPYTSIKPGLLSNEEE